MSDSGPGLNSGQTPFTAGNDSDRDELFTTTADVASINERIVHRHDDGQFATTPDPVGLAVALNSPNLLPPLTQTETTVVTEETFNPANAKQVSGMLVWLANQVINASDLSAKFNDLAALVDNLKSDITQYRNTIASQDRELATMRRERVDLQRENAEVHADNTAKATEIVKLTEQVTSANTSRDKFQADYISQCHESERLLRERDEALTKLLVMENDRDTIQRRAEQLEREATEARATLERVRASLKPQLAA